LSGGSLGERVAVAGRTLESTVATLAKGAFDATPPVGAAVLDAVLWLTWCLVVAFFFGSFLATLWLCVVFDEANAEAGNATTARAASATDARAKTVFMGAPWAGPYTAGPD
jgi:hypothetical protein